VQCKRSLLDLALLLSLMHVHSKRCTKRVEKTKEMLKVVEAGIDVHSIMLVIKETLERLPCLLPLNEPCL